MLLAVALAVTQVSTNGTAARPVAVPVTYSIAREGISLVAPGGWSLAEDSSTDGYWAMWLDPVAQRVPKGRLHLNDGAKIELRVLHTLPAGGLAEDLLKGAALAENVDSAGTAGVGGVLGQFVETSSTADGGTRTKTVAFLSNNRFHLALLAVFNYSATGAEQTSNSRRRSTTL